MPKLSADKKTLLDKTIRDKVYVEAMKLLAANRSQLFTMAELADKVGLAKGTLYNYFADKSAVILYLDERMTQKIYVDLRRELEQCTDYKEGLKLAFRSFGRTMSEHYYLHVATLVISYEQQNTIEPLKLSDAPVTLIMPYMEDFFKRGIAAGVFKDLPVEYLSGFLAALMHGLSVMVNGKMKKDQTDYEAQGAAMEELLVAALCR